ncbi:MAG TPA: FAD-dependent monooxygenase [Candidatus Omnitrophota bacterium]|nr:FAD-dependent monooxygenase [Candidatus Omnitrophota bacterium]
METDVCIVGAGPAGILLGLLLAQKGVSVVVIESQKDFAREYRGEVLMPRFSQTLKKVGLFEYIEQQQPQLKLRTIEMYFKDWRIASLNFGEISPNIPFAIWMPQPILLNALYSRAQKFPNFKLLFSTMVRDVLQNQGQITGVLVEEQGRRLEISAKITVGADGRFSTVRKAAGFKTRYEKYDFDIIWFTVKHPQNYDNTVRAFFSPHHNYLILPKYPDAIQCGLIVAPGGFEKFRKKGIEFLRKELLSSHSVLHSFARELKDFHPFNVLQARVSFIDEWAKDGCLLIGDAAHTCSPAGAIGVSVAVETAVAAADVIVDSLKQKDYSAGFLSQVQKLREKDVIGIQRIQSGLTNVLFSRIPGFQMLTVGILFIMARLGILRRLQRRIAVAKG